MPPVKIAYDIYKQDHGLLADEDIKQNIINRLKEIHFDNGGVTILLPQATKEKSLSPIYPNWPGGGYIDYTWDKPETRQPVAKIAYAIAYDD